MKTILIVAALVAFGTLIGFYASQPAPQGNTQSYSACEKFAAPLEVACVPNGVQKTVDGKTLQGN